MAFWQRTPQTTTPGASAPGAAASAPAPGIISVSPARAKKQSWGVTYPMRPETGFQAWYGYKGIPTVPHENMPRQPSEHAGIG